MGCFFLPKNRHFLPRKRLFLPWTIILSLKRKTRKIAIFTVKFLPSNFYHEILPSEFKKRRNSARFWSDALQSVWNRKPWNWVKNWTEKAWWNAKCIREHSGSIFQKKLPRNQKMARKKFQNIAENRIWSRQEAIFSRMVADCPCEAQKRPESTNIAFCKHGDGRARKTSRQIPNENGRIPARLHEKRPSNDQKKSKTVGAKNFTA